MNLKDEQQENVNTCKYCYSSNIIKYGIVKDIQRYYCKNCHRKFIATDVIPKMHYAKSQIAEVIDLYYEGLSLRDIRDIIVKNNKKPVSYGTLFNWVKRFTDIAIAETNNYKPDVGEEWIALDTLISRKNFDIWAWDLIDKSTMFLITSQVSKTHTHADGDALMKVAQEITGKSPNIIYSWQKKRKLNHTSFDVQKESSIVKEMHNITQKRDMAIVRIKSLESIHRFIDGWRFNYNFLKTNSYLNQTTPAANAGISYSFRSWADVIDRSFDQNNISLSDKEIF